MEIEVAALKRVGLTGLNLCPEDIPSVLNDENMSRCLGSGLRYFTVPEWREIGIELCPLVEALRSGRLTLLPSQTSYLLANKRVMAWLSRGLPWMSAVDRQVVDRYLPWTREIHPGQVDLYGKSVDLEKLLARHQERFVIKKNVGMKAEQVAIGHDATASQWRQELNDAFENDDAVAQEYHSVDTYELAMWPDGARRCSVPVRPVWNPFFFGRHFGGFGVRYSLTSGHDPISSGHGALANAAHEY
ncbi:hypothetical protein [Sciscionella marina]|uniref:hypothetical protein n=1 Tax=Sciscionella marina TaxID=508770 RepID=UPI0012F6B44E|nr:hypothetical protein [Sciscionella marina]